MCKNDQEFKDKDKEMGWTAEKIVEAEMKMPYEAEDILANLPGVGGVQGFANPYGLGVQEEHVVQRKEDKGALGELGFFGYVQSMPGVIEEVYMHPGKAGNRRAVEVEMQQEMTEDKDKDSEYSEDCEDGLGEDGEEAEEAKGEVEEMDVD